MKTIRIVETALKCLFDGEKSTIESDEESNRNGALEYVVKEYLCLISKVQNLGQK